MTAAEILRGVADLFETPGTWTQGAWARDANGVPLVRPLDSEAVCWCLLGAIRRVRGPAISDAEDEAREAVRDVLRRRTGLLDVAIGDWNDAHARDVQEVRHVAMAAALRLEARP